MKHVRMHIKIPNIAFQSAVVSFCFLIFCCFAWVFTSFIKCNFCFGAYLLENQNRIDVRGCTLYIYMCLQLYIFFWFLLFFNLFQSYLAAFTMWFLGNSHPYRIRQFNYLLVVKHYNSHIRCTPYAIRLHFVFRFAIFSIP